MTLNPFKAFSNLCAKRPTYFIVPWVIGVGVFGYYLEYPHLSKMTL